MQNNRRVLLLSLLLYQKSEWENQCYISKGQSNIVTAGAGWRGVVHQLCSVFTNLIINVYCVYHSGTYKPLSWTRTNHQPYPCGSQSSINPLLYFCWEFCRMVAGNGCPQLNSQNPRKTYLEGGAHSRPFISLEEGEVNTVLLEGRDQRQQCSHFWGVPTSFYSLYAAEQSSDRISRRGPSET